MKRDKEIEERGKGYMKREKGKECFRKRESETRKRERGRVKK